MLAKLNRRIKRAIVSVGTGLLITSALASGQPQPAAVHPSQSKDKRVVNARHPLNQQQHQTHNRTHRSRAKLKKPTDASGLFSNAFNFKGYWGSKIDPRTGNLSTYVRVGSMIGNDNHGPNFSLILSYDSGSRANYDGLGIGWSWNITHFNSQTNTLVTSNGKSYVLESVDGKWVPKYHKLKDIIISGTPNTNLVITYKGGYRETLSPQGYETKLEQANGQYLTFDYTTEGNTQLLKSIEDQNGHKITIEPVGTDLQVISKGTTGNDIVYTLTGGSNAGNEIRSIALPSLDTQVTCNKYQPWKRLRHDGTVAV